MQETALVNVVETVPLPPLALNRKGHVVLLLHEKLELTFDQLAKLYPAFGVAVRITTFICAPAAVL